MLLSLLLGGLALFIALVALTVIRAPGRAVAAAPAVPGLAGSTMLVTFTLDDFDDPKRDSGSSPIIPRPPNDFFANQSPYTIDGTGAVMTPLPSPVPTPIPAI